MFKAPKRYTSDDETLERVQDSIITALNPLLSVPISNGRLIEDVRVLTGAPRTISHKLVEKLSGWIVVKRSANAQVWDSQATNELQSKTLVLNSSADVTVSLWVF